MEQPIPHTTAAAPRFDSLEQEVFLNVWRTYDRLRVLEDELFQRFDLTPQQYNVLRLLERHRPGGLPTLQLAARLVSRSPDITRMLDKLATHGWIVRERRDDNRRVVVVQITPTGMSLLEQISEPLRACHTHQLGHMSADNLQQLRDLLHEARRPHETSTGPWTADPRADA